MRLKHDYLYSKRLVDAFGGAEEIIQAGKLAATIQATQCPFCGGEAVAALAQLYGAPSGRVECDRCHAATAWRSSGWDCRNEKAVTFADALTRSVQDWNRRCPA